jgi:polar amino acid transport system substrate-binding protein
LPSGENKMRVLALAMLLGLTTAPWAVAQTPVDAELAPQGRIRVAIIGVNPVLVTNKPDGTLAGISMDLGSFIAAKLGAQLVPVVYANTKTYSQSFGKGEWDIAIGPKRASDAAVVDYSPDFMLVDNIYVEAPGKDFADAAQIDRPGVKIGVALDGAPDKFLTAAVRSGTIVRLPGQVSDAVEALRDGKVDAYGSNGEFVYAIAAKLPGAKIVPGAFTTVHMAVLVPKGRSVAAVDRLSEIVKAAIATGIPQQAIERQQLKGVRPTSG